MIDLLLVVFRYLIKGRLIFLIRKFEKCRTFRDTNENDKGTNEYKRLSFEWHKRNLKNLIVAHWSFFNSSIFLLFAVQTK